MKTIRIFLFLSVAVLHTVTLSAQENKEAKDSIRLANHDPMKSWQYSAIVPGLGQIYNRKIWKVPIVYIGGAVCYYLYYDFSKGYHAYHDAYVGMHNYGKMQEEAAQQLVDYYNNSLVYDGPSSIEVFYNLDDIKVQTSMERFQKYKERMVVYMFGLYFLNIIDALVDGYMFQYDVTDELTLNWQPSLLKSLPNNSASPALSLVLNF